MNATLAGYKTVLHTYSFLHITHIVSLSCRSKFTDHMMDITNLDACVTGGDALRISDLPRYLSGRPRSRHVSILNGKVEWNAFEGWRKQTHNKRHYKDAMCQVD